MSTLDAQFGHPNGLLGSIVGRLMALEHKALHKAVIDQLQLKDTDQVLEIGFGPGTAVRLAAEHAAFVAGIDTSPEMVRQASRRNLLMIKNGHVELREGTAISLPYQDDQFSVVFEINSFDHWEDGRKGLMEIFRVLRKGGKILLCLRADDPISQESELLKIGEMLRSLGFIQINSQKHNLGHGGVVVTAKKQ